MCDSYLAAGGLVTLLLRCGAVEGADALCSLHPMAAVGRSGSRAGHHAVPAAQYQQVVPQHQQQHDPSACRTGTGPVARHPPGVAGCAAAVAATAATAAAEAQALAEGPDGQLVVGVAAAAATAAAAAAEAGHLAVVPRPRLAAAEGLQQATAIALVCVLTSLQQGVLP